MQRAMNLIVVIILSTMCHAQTYNIRGIVTDITGTPLSGAEVKLEKGGISSVTLADGRFTLSNSGTSGKAIPSVTEDLFAVVQNGHLRISIAKKSAIEVIVYSLQGKALFSSRQTLDAGTYYLPCLPRKSAGVYLYCVKSGRSKVVAKEIWTQGVFERIKGVSPGVSAGFTSLNKKTAITEIIDDTISVTRVGFLNSRVKVGNSDTNNIEIKLVFLADTVKDPVTIQDIDSNVYHVVRIGNQLWTAENLRTTKYSDGTSIPLVTDSIAWSTLITPGLCYYNNWTATDSIKRYGALYNWHALNTGKLAPTGWHVPDSTEWNILEKYLIDNGFNYDSTLTGNKVAKALAAQAGWPQSTTSGAIGNNALTNNRSGFSALPAGYRVVSNGCKFSDLGTSGFWWSSTQVDTTRALSRILTSINGNPGFSAMWSAKNCGFSVRLLKDTYNQFSLTVSTNNGIIIINPDKATYKSGEVISLAARADSGYSFWGWSGDACGTNPTTYVTMNENKKIRAIFMGTMTDIEGNVYRTVKIGRQVWTVDNLRTTEYNDGTTIPFLPDSADWCNAIGYCYYDNTTNRYSMDKIGALYNGNVVLTGKLAPSGWHVPAMAEWQVLTNYLETNGYSWDGKVTSNMIAKALAAQADWIGTDIPGTVGNDQATNNSSGFSGLPGGRRHTGGSFMEGGSWAHWWCSNADPYQKNFSLSNDQGSVWTGAGFSEFGLSVRLVKNQ